MCVKIKFYCALIAVSSALFAQAVDVYVIEQKSLDGATTQLSKETVATGEGFTTQTAPDVSGAIFTHWTLSTQQEYVSRDGFGRASDNLSFVVYEETIATAHYLSETVDADVDDMPDGHELYWYGNLLQGADSDTDGDGVSFAEEIDLGTNPLFPERIIRGGVGWSGGETLRYNPEGLACYIIRSEPEGELFASVTNCVKIGTEITTTTQNIETTTFAYWTTNGVRVADSFGRALDAVTFIMGEDEIELVANTKENESERVSLYWYGRSDVASDSDTDGDGISFAEEIDLGTNPLFPERIIRGGVGQSAGNVLEMNLQPFEQITGALIGEVYHELFTSPVAGNANSSRTFDGAANPVVVDLNDDGLFDFVIETDKGTKTVLLNIGSQGNPQFKETEWSDIWQDVFLMVKTKTLEGIEFDVQPNNVVSWAFADGDNDGVEDLLIADSEGRIWFYKGVVTGEEGCRYELQHKVWGGSHAGFANGLMLAVVDWEDDGDLDCICGTAEGKLMLLRDPKVGRPTNLKVLAGIDNVLLTWEPNQQSRIRGYKVYRGTGNGEQGTGNGYVALVPGVPNVSTMYTTALPRYRDFPNSSTPNFSYKVSSISRFYTAGNSTPTVTESPATEAVSAQLGTVKFFWNDVICKLGANANVMLSIENSMNFNVAGKTQVVSYDSTYLKPIKVVPSGLTEGVSFTESVADGKWTINLINGILPAGSGKFFTLVFETLKEGETKVGDAKVTIEKVESIDPTVVPPWLLGDMNGDGRLTKEDAQILARLKQSSKPKWNERELKAGDFNGNGKLDNADYQSLREKLKSLGVFGGGK